MSHTLRTIRVGVWLLAAICLGFVGLAWIAPDAIDRLVGRPGHTRLPMTIGGPFDLIDHNSRRVTEKDFADRPYLIFFGFTFCPDLCPTTLTYLSDLLAEVGPEAESLPVLFVTVDPARDTPAVLKDYVGAFGSNFLGLTGSDSQVTKVIGDWGIYAKRTATGGDDYSFDHTASVFLIDADGRFRGTIDTHDETPGANLTKLKKLAAGG